MTNNKFHAWKINSRGEPIEGTDRIFKGSRRKLVLELLAFEEGIKLQPNTISVECKDGTRWVISKI